MVPHLCSACLFPYRGKAVLAPLRQRGEELVDVANLRGERARLRGAEQAVHPDLDVGVPARSWYVNTGILGVGAGIR